MVPKQTLLVEGKVFEIDRARSWPSEWEPDKAFNFAHSLALICPKCLKQWAILAFEGEDIHPQGAYCSSHEGEEKWFYNRPRVPGSIFPDYSLDLPLLSALPEELLKRELLLHIKRMERENGISQN